MAQTNKSYYHRGGDTPLLGTTISAHFLSIVEKYPKQEAIISLPQKKHLTYQQFSAAIDELARGLMGLGFKRGDRIGIWSTNNIEWLLLQMATARMGVILVNINPAYRINELEYALKCSEVNGLLAIPQFAAAIIPTCCRNCCRN